MEIKLRQGRSGDFKGRVGSLSTSHVTDSFASVQDFNAGPQVYTPRFRQFLEENRVTYDDKYGPDLALNNERFKRFEKRRGAKVLVSESTSRYFYALIDNEWLRRRLLSSPLLSSIPVREDLYELPRDVVSSTNSPCRHDGDKLVMHLCVLTGFGVVDGQPYYEILNSWGECWSSYGFGQIPPQDIFRIIDFEVTERLA
ncbi:Unknown protein [Striga hermonthica]|uniref:Peptidase C1A papain C-terminal domain-containing protein n=1 Tax=Striga hermonthica TaxID=68872 RepID=A0A9N7NPA5_STRHE|nr:Unknown protein [Striga hermonthica]